MTWKRSQDFAKQNCETGLTLHLSVIADETLRT
jgi:hypothetical protein